MGVFKGSVIFRRPLLIDVPGCAVERANLLMGSICVVRKAGEMDGVEGIKNLEVLESPNPELVGKSFDVVNDLVIEPYFEIPIYTVVGVVFSKVLHQEVGLGYTADLLIRLNRNLSLLNHGELGTDLFINNVKLELSEGSSWVLTSESAGRVKAWIEDQIGKVPEGTWYLLGQASSRVHEQLSVAV